MSHVHQLIESEMFTLIFWRQFNQYLKLSQKDFSVKDTIFSMNKNMLF